jgi:hypothetical protein
MEPNRPHILSRFLSISKSVLPEKHSAARPFPSAPPVSGGYMEIRFGAQHRFGGFRDFCDSAENRFGGRDLGETTGMGRSMDPLAAPENRRDRTRLAPGRESGPS